MKKLLIITLMLITAMSFAQYSVGEIVEPADNLSWTITGPTGDPEVGLSSDIFTKIIDERKAVMLFEGLTS